jgi:hypothetical protein
LSKPIKNGQWAIRVLCTLALLFVGFGHQPIALAVATDTPLEIASYALPDGSLPVLCVTASDDGQKSDGKHAHPQQGCDACRISASTLLPSPPDLLSERLYVAASTEMRPYRRAVHRRILSLATAPRAPPIILT